ncbi:MAG: Rieske 2Fe-2S domain-containing protein [Deltaproteobacteria bacterium]|nr:Rieske 2Fe-2S domain-containing protein [Deltaproteobacteria bacterium]
MLSREENEILTRVGPGTPGGEMLRRYWWPVGFSQEVDAKDRPRRIQLLGEDLVLFRDGSGKLGVLHIGCMHRGTSLEFGRVEDRGIRCCYHGWLYDTEGRCLEQPAEPDGSTFRNRITQPAYKAEELGGLIFAYLGPEPAPLLPRYDLLVREDGGRVVGAGEEHCNWLQRAENSVDQSHLVALHASVYPQFALKKPRLDWQKTWYGIRIETQIDTTKSPKISHWLFPAHTRHTTARKGEKPDHALRFRVPTNDQKTTTYWVKFYPQEPCGLETKGLRVREPGVFTRIDDGWWGIESHEQDRVAQESQGPIYDRSKEHLGSSDRGIIMLREMIHQAMEDVNLGKDPVGVMRDSHRNEIVEFDARMEEMDALA